jgi:hypothetical protein
MTSPPPARHSADDLRVALVADPDSHALLGIRRGARDLLALEPTLAGIQERLQRYSLFEVLETLGRMNAVLRDTGPRSSNAQVLLLSALFAPEDVRRMLGRLDTIMRQDAAESPGRRPTPPAIFEPRLLAAMAVLAGSTLPPIGAPTGAPRDGLGEALMMLNDLIETVLSPVGADPATPEGRLRWVHYFAVAAFARGHDPMVQAVVRTAEIYLDAHDDLRDDPHYVDLAALFEEATGLTLDAYVFVTVALIGTMLEVTARTAATKSALISKDFFGGFPPEMRARFLALAGQDSATFCQEAAKAWPPGALRPITLLPVEQSPLVRNDEGPVCLSVQLLERRLTAGLYHVLLNARGGDEHRKFRQRYQQFIGRVFERYVERATRRIGGYLAARGGWHPRERRGGGPTRYLTEAEMLVALAGATSATPSVCDGVLVVGQDVLLIESKARFFSLPARTGEAPDELLTRLREITVGGARQLDATLSHIAAGQLRAVGLAPERIRRVFPIVVSLEEPPITPEVRAWIDDEMAAAGVLQRDTVGPMRVYAPEFFAARDLEWIEAVVEHTPHRPGDLIARKHSRPFWYGISLVAWGDLADVLREDGGPVLVTHHQQRREELSRRMRAYFRTHSAADASSGEDLDASEDRTTT